jgi:transposase-like protein
MSMDLASKVRGLSEAGFRERFGAEEQCLALLLEMRWGKGFKCERCGCESYARMRCRKQIQCNRCKHQIGHTAGTIFHSTKLPLTTWFQAIYHLTQSKGGISSIELGRRLGVRQGTAWLMKQKLMAAMADRDAGKPRMAGRVEIDDAYLGGERSGKRGRGAAGKTPFVAAVETTAERKPRRIKLQIVKGFRKKEVERLAQSSFDAGANVVSDGLSCWRAVEAAGCDHLPMKTGHGKRAARWTPFHWVNTTLGNIKTALAGTYHHVSPKHAQRYLASFAWRFNRRYQLDTLTERLMWAGLHAKPHPYRVITAG